MIRIEAGGADADHRVDQVVALVRDGFGNSSALSISTQLSAEPFDKLRGTTRARGTPMASVPGAYRPSPTDA